MRSRTRVLLVGVCVAALGTQARGLGTTGEFTLHTADQLSLEFSASGELQDASVDGNSLLPADPKMSAVFSICDVTLGDEFATPKASTVVLGAKSIRQEYFLDEWSLQATALLEAQEELIKVNVSVSDTSGEDRGLLVRFALPIAASGWSWWDDMDTNREIADSGVYEHSKGIREFAALPEWSDKPELKMGSHSVNFCNVITGSAGLCFAVPLDQPRIFRSGYDADRELFYMVYDLALAKETQPPSSAKFTFYLYRCIPEWGMRSALDRYYRLFPHFFTKHVKQQGMWMAFSNLSDIDHVNEFRFAVQEGAPDPGYDDRLGVESLTYFTHAGMFARIPDFDPNRDPEPSYDRQLAAMRDHFARSTGSAKIFDDSGLFDADGRLSIKRTAVYGHIISQYNLDPVLPYGRHLLKKTDDVFRDYRESRGGELDGFYYDGITTGLNYRRSHFRFAGYPLIWDPSIKQPVLYNYFSSVEFARAAADKLHAQDKITMMNGAMGSSFYTAPYLDVMGAETGLRIRRTDFNYVRSICWQKPFVTLLKGNFSSFSKDDVTLFMKRCVAFGVFPGFFDWPPSGLGPGSRYWDHAQWYERDRLNHRKYQALCQQLADAGWEPLTAARSSDSRLAVERFGNATDGEVFFTVLNDRPHAVDTSVSIPATAVPDEFTVVEAVSRQWLAAAQINGAELRIPLQLEPESLAVLHIAPKTQLARSHAGEILDNLARRRRMSEIGNDRPESLVHWPRGRYGGYERDDAGDGSCVRFATESGASTKGLTQWVMLYQEHPDPLRLRFRTRGEKDTTTQGNQISVELLLCHVNMQTRFTERTTETYELETDSQDWREQELLIEPERPLRSIQLSLYVRRPSGTFWLDDVSVTPLANPDQEYVIDPELEQWYERPTAEASSEMDDRLAPIETAMTSMVNDAPGDVLEACTTALSSANSCGTWIRDRGLENPLRRELRELEDVQSRLALVGAMELGVRGPHVDAPLTVVPGEEVPVRVGLSGVPHTQADYTLAVPQGWRCEPADLGSFTVTVAEDTVRDSEQLVATATIRTETGKPLTLASTIRISVVPHLEASMRLLDVASSGEEFHFEIGVSNHANSPANVTLRTEIPENWQGAEPVKELALQKRSRQSVRFFATPAPGAAPGPYAVRAELTSRALAEPLKFEHPVIFAPASINLLSNASFESEDGARWADSEGGFEVDTSQAHSGAHSLKLHNRSSSLRSGAAQTIVLNQSSPHPIFVRGHARAEDVSGHRDRTFSIYVDIYYTDGTPLYGQTIDWQTGTTDWQYGDMIIQPAKPIRNVNVYLLLRGHSGTAWFDDIFVAEVPWAP